LGTIGSIRFTFTITSSSPHCRSSYFTAISLSQSMSAMYKHSSPSQDACIASIVHTHNSLQNHSNHTVRRYQEPPKPRSLTQKTPSANIANTHNAAPPPLQNPCCRVDSQRTPRLHLPPTQHHYARNQPHNHHNSTTPPIHPHLSIPIRNPGHPPHNPKSRAHPQPRNQSTTTISSLGSLGNNNTPLLRLLPRSIVCVVLGVWLFLVDE
ncbi:hypothetical protein T440DRAFT_546221, partial [Plenodomus tracheiphilus IPT5]